VREIELKVGEVHELELPGHGSAGYSWQTTIIGPDGVLEIRRAPSGPVPTAAPGGPPPPAGSLPEILDLVGLSEGRVQLRLTLRRSWEQDTPPLEEDEVAVIVTA
jgi:hypothetical protein